MFDVSLKNNREKYELSAIDLTLFECISQKKKLLSFVKPEGYFNTNVSFI